MEPNLPNSRELLQNFLKSCEQGLNSFYHETFKKVASLRTTGNREFLVREFFEAVLPLSVKVRNGGVLIDALGGCSRDVDLVLLNPWANPVWPHLHGLIPAEGVLSAVLVETQFPPAKGKTKKGKKKLPSIWDQCISVRSLLKSIKPGNYAHKVRRTFRVETGVWFWGFTANGNKALQVLTGMASWRKNFESQFKASLNRAADWEGPQFKTGQGIEVSDKMNNDYKKYQKAMGWYPSWIYVHAEKPSNRLLMVKLQGRHKYNEQGKQWETVTAGEADKKEYQVEFATEGYVWLDGVTPKSACSAQDIQWSENNAWAYAYCGGNSQGPDPLQVLAFHLARSTTSYGWERPDHGMYLKLLTDRREDKTGRRKKK